MRGNMWKRNNKQMTMILNKRIMLIVNKNKKYCIKAKIIFRRRANIRYRINKEYNS